MADKALRRLEKALDLAAQQLQAAGAAVGSLRLEMAAARRDDRQGRDGEGAGGSRGGRRGALLDAKTMRNGIFQFLRSSPGPMATAEIMTSLVNGSKLKFDSARDKTNFSTRISIAMRRYEAQGLIKTVGKAGKGRPIKWALVRRGAKPAAA